MFSILGMQDPVFAFVARNVCVPAGAVALTSLAAFLLAVPSSHRATFFRHESFGGLVRRQWDELHHDPMDADSSRAIMCSTRGFEIVWMMGERCRDWLRTGAPKWEKEPPEWYTPEWVHALPPELAYCLIVDDAREQISQKRESEFLLALESSVVFARPHRESFDRSGAGADVSPRMPWGPVTV
jgi:hypothetical protein